jgi:hypothetical protein
MTHCTASPRFKRMQKVGAISLRAEPFTSEEIADAERRNSLHEQLMCAILRGEVTPWSLGAEPDAASLFVEAARYHGVLPLLDLQFRTCDDFQGWPAAVLKACREETLGRVMYDLAHRAEIVQVLDALASAGVRPLLLKGTPLAYSHYPNPALRHRSDDEIRDDGDECREPPEKQERGARVPFPIRHAGV